MKRKTVGIITILKVNNYGAELQAFALQRKLQLMGYDSEIIDYLFYKNKRHKREKISMPFYFYPLKMRIKEIILPFYEKMKLIGCYRENKKREKRFEDFHRNTKFSLKTYESYSELYNTPPQYDVYCVGSDQVWNPGCYTNLSPYFLSFASQDAKKISYASSFGVSELPKSSKKMYAELLKKMSYISVREDAGVSIVRELINKEAELVADPTMLLTKEEWEDVEKEYENIPRRYVFIYELHPIEYIKIIAKKVAKELNVPIVRICKSVKSIDEKDGIINIVDAGPAEFLSLVHNALCVVTNSFHGTVFSIIYNRSFYCVVSDKIKNNSRQISILNQCGLLDRLIYDRSDLLEFKFLEIDYGVPNERLESFRNSSVNYLKKAVDE